MPLAKRLVKFGDSRGLVIPKPFLQQLNIGMTDRVVLTMDEGRIIIRKHQPGLTLVGSRA